MDIVKRFICGAKEAYKKVDDHSFNFPITIESAYRLATNIEKLLKKHEAVVPIEKDEVAVITRYRFDCPCGAPLLVDQPYCAGCGKRVKWNEMR